MVLPHEDVSRMAALRVVMCGRNEAVVETGWSRDQVENHWAGLCIPEILCLVFVSRSQLEAIWKLLMVKLQ